MGGQDQQGGWVGQKSTLSSCVCWGGFGNGQQACRGQFSGSFTARSFSSSSESGLRSSLFPALRTNLLCAFSSPNGLDYLSSSRAPTRAFKCRGWRAPSR